MGSFSVWHWTVALVLLAALAAFGYLLCSLFWTGARSASKGKLVAAALLLPLAALAVFAIVKTVGSPATQGVSPTPAQQQPAAGLPPIPDGYKPYEGEVRPLR